MKRISLFIFLIVYGFITDVFAQVPGLQWARQMGGSDSYVNGKSIATDASGNVYSTGEFIGTVDFNSGAGTFELTADDNSGFVSKVDANGNFVWAIKFSGDETSSGNSIAIDADGNVVVAGSFTGTADFDPGAGVSELTSLGNTDAVILKLASNGNFIFAKQLGGGDYDSGVSIVTGALSSIYITGYFADTGDFNPDDAVSFELTSSGSYDVFVAKLNKNGIFQWANNYGEDGVDFYNIPASITIDPSENIYVAGTIENNDAFSKDIFINKIGSSGNLIWSQQLMNGEGNSVHTIRSDPSGNIYYSGSFDGTLDFNPLGTPVELEGPDSYICKINSSGQVIWAKKFEFNSYVDQPNTMSVDINGNLFFSGYFQPTTFDVDPGSGVANLYTTSTDVGGTFILKLDNAGDYVWAQSYVNPQGSGSFGINAITTDNAANIYLSGGLSESMTFSTGTCTPNAMTSIGDTDLILIKLNPTSIPSTCFGVIEQPISSVACQGSTVSLIAFAAGAPRISYQWQKFNGSAFVDISDQEDDGEGGDEGYYGTNTPFLNVTTIDDTGTGEFRCKVSGESVADAFSDVAILTYSGSSSIPHVVANSGCGPGQFLITAYGSAEGTYRWYDSNQNLIDGQVNSTFTTPLISVPTNFYVSKGTAECQSHPVIVQVNTKACAPVPGLVWVAQPDPASNSYVSFKNMIIDASGNTYTTGTFTGTVDFDSGPGVVTLTTADPDGQENFILKLNKDRDVVWVKSLSDTNYGLGIKISVDGSGGLYLTGGFRETVDFDPGPGSFPMTATTDNLDVFIVKLNTDGNFIWARQIRTIFSNNSVFAQGITSDANGVYTTGSFTGSVDFDPNAGTQQLNSAGSVFFSDIFISKLDPSGNYGWAYRFGRTSATDGGIDIKVDGSGNVYSTGRFSGIVDFDPGAGVSNLTGGGGTDYYIQKLTNSGVFQWAIASGGANVELPIALALDASGNPHLTGTFTSTLDFDPGTGVTTLSSGNGLIFVLKLNGTNGNFVWAKNLGATFAAQANDITIDQSGGVLLTGFSEGTASNHPDFDPGPSEFLLNSNVNRDAFVSRLDVNGDFSWAYNLASTGLSYYDNEGLSIVIDTDGSIYTTGPISYTSDMDPGHCTFPLFNSTGNTFIQKIKPGVKALCFNLLPVAASVCDGVPASFSVAATGTTNITYRWQKLNTATSLFENLTNTGGYSGVTTPILSINTTGLFGAGDYRCYVTGDAAPDKFSDAVSLTVNPNNPPTTTGASGCSGSVLLTAAGGTDGQYRWYTQATDGAALSETSGEFNTPSLSVTTTYYVSLVNACQSTRTPVVATITGVTPTVTSAATCTGADATLKAAGGSNGQYRWYDAETGGSALSETSDTFSITSLAFSVTYYVSIDNGSCESERVAVDATVASPLSAPSVTGSSHCGEGTGTLNASGGTDGQYRWYTLATGGTPLAGEVNGTLVTPSLNTTTNYYVSLNNGCESERTLVVAEIKSTPAVPSVTGQNVCGISKVTLTASGGTNGQYRWYTTATGGTAISGEVNNMLTISSLTTTTSYYVSISSDCESERVMVTATIFTPPDKPTINSSITPNGNTISLCKDPVTLTGPNGFSSYKWSNGATTQSIVISSPATNISLIVTNANDCKSPLSDALDIVALASCINSAPNINTTNLTTALEGSVTLNLLTLISDDDNNLDPNSLRIVTQPSSGASASIDASANLIVDYKGISFSGKDRIGIEACDLSAVCTQQEITIDVVGDVVVYNGVSPNGDGKNDYLILQYIDVLEETKNNKVSIFNRWGDVVFEVSNYNNTNNYFAGVNKNGNELPSGNYFYKIDYQSGKKSMTGYLTLKR